MRLTLVTALLALGGAISCATDATTSPARPPSNRAPAPARADLLDGAITVVPLHRTSPLANSQSASARIGALGGRLSLPGAGLTVVVPPLALVTPVTITVTALAGSNVAYEFTPHGISFLAPLVATQDLRNTEAHTGGPIDPLALHVGYFPDSSNVTSVTELLDLRVDLLSQTSVALLSHFSGYIWSSGREGDLDSGSASTIRRPTGVAIAASHRLVRP